MNTIAALLVFTCWMGVNGHGRFINPPSRGSMWRFGYDTPGNWQDNELFCGGINNQWDEHDGKCGLCGDPYQGPRLHEAGGPFATNITVGCYKTSGKLPVTVEITAWHKGYSEFRLCKNDNFRKNFTADCLELLYESGSDRYQFPVTQNGDLTATLQLPEGTTCSQCVIQWKYRSGNSWGCDGDDCCVGCGRKQEEFYGCSDIEIRDDC